MTEWVWWASSPPLLVTVISRATSSEGFMTATPSSLRTSHTFSFVFYNLRWSALKNKSWRYKYYIKKKKNNYLLTEQEHFVCQDLLTQYRQNKNHLECQKTDNSSYLDFTFCSLLALLTLPVVWRYPDCCVLCSWSRTCTVTSGYSGRCCHDHNPRAPGQSVKNNGAEMISLSSFLKRLVQKVSMTCVFVPRSRCSFAGGGWGPASCRTDLLWSGSSDRSSTETRWRWREYWAACLWFHAGTEESSLLVWSGVWRFSISGCCSVKQYFQLESGVSADFSPLFTQLQSSSGWTLKLHSWFSSPSVGLKDVIEHCEEKNQQILILTPPSASQTH